MKIEGGYIEAADHNLAVKSSVARRGQNFPCPLAECVAVLESEEKLKEHMEAGNHVMDVLGSSKSLGDRTKAAFITGLNKQADNRKLGW